MTRLRELYRCDICLNVVEIAHEGASSLVCCGEPMKQLKAKTEDEGHEKHVPVTEEFSGGVRVKIGSARHPMEEKHFIKFIEVLTENKVIRRELAPGGDPEADFRVKKEEIVEVREFCTVHGLWKSSYQLSVASDQLSVISYQGSLDNWELKKGELYEKCEGDGNRKKFA